MSHQMDQLNSDAVLCNLISCMKYDWDKVLLRSTDSFEID